MSIIISLGVFTIFLVYYFHDPHIDESDIQEISIIAIYYPLKAKIITNDNYIKEFVDFFNSLDFKPTINNEKGWQYQIKLNESTSANIIFMNDKICFNSRWYKTDENMSSKLKSIYDSFECLELSFFTQ